MGSEDAEPTGIPTAKAVSEYVTQHWSGEGVYARGTGSQFCSVILPGRFDLFPTFVDDLRQQAGVNSRIVYVCTTEESRLDVYLGSMYDAGVATAAARPGPSTCRIIALGSLSGLISAMGILMAASLHTVSQSV